MQYTIVGTVTNHDGTPIPAVTVTVAEGPGPAPDLGMLTNDDGEFAVNGLTVPGTYRLKLISMEGVERDTSVRVEREVTRVDITLPGG